MIGQKSLLTTLGVQIDNEVFPQFSILVGSEGSGRKTLARIITQLLHANSVICGVSADEIKSLTDMAVKVADKTVYIIADADNMSVNAINALLKITEEPPKNAYFIMTIQDDYNVLSTIKSRGTIYRVESYSAEEVMQYALSIKDYYTSEETEIVTNICLTPGDVEKILKEDIIEFWEYVIKVIDNIGSVSIANSFKIADKIAFKDEEGKYNLKLFWRAFMLLCTEYMTLHLDDRVKYANWVRITSQYLQNLRITGLNKQALFDGWVLEIRGNQ